MNKKRFGGGGFKNQNNKNHTSNNVILSNKAKNNAHHPNNIGNNNPIGNNHPNNKTNWSNAKNQILFQQFLAAGRFCGMSNSLPAEMSRYALSPQDGDFRRGYNFMGAGGSANSLTNNAICNVAPTASNNSLNCIGNNTMAGNSGAGSGGSAGSVGGGDDNLNDQRSNGTNLIVNYLPQDMTDRELYALFRTIGPINTCRIMRDYKTGYSFGYAFVDFTTEIDSQRAINTLNGITVRNKRLKVSFARPGGESIKDTNLYVTNLPRTITEDQLDTIFGKYGSIVQKNILRDKLTGKPRGVAFVRYNKREEAQEAIAALNNVIPEGAAQSLSVRLAEEHGKAKAAHFMTQLGMGPPAPPPQQQQQHMHMNAQVGGGGGGGVISGYNNMVHRAWPLHSYLGISNPSHDGSNFAAKEPSEH